MTVAKVAVPAAGTENTIAFCTSGLKIKVVSVTALASLNIYCYYTSVVQVRHCVCQTLGALAA